MTTVGHLRNLTGPELNFQILLTPVILGLAMDLQFDQKTVILHHEHKGLNMLLHISPRNPAVTLPKVHLFLLKVTKNSEKKPMCQTTAHCNVI